MLRRIFSFAVFLFALALLIPSGQNRSSPIPATARASVPSFVANVVVELLVPRTAFAQDTRSSVDTPALAASPTERRLSKRGAVAVAAALVVIATVAWHLSTRGYSGTRMDNGYNPPPNTRAT